MQKQILNINKYNKTILEKLGIFGWKDQEENLLLASLLTGDPLLLIATHGTAKTGMTTNIAKALGVKFVSFDASKALFEDVLGYPNIKQLQQGKIEYIKSSVTIFDKEFVLIDELNRALVEMQSKWLEIIRSRKIMGMETKVKWVWSAMNPASYSGTQPLDQALVGRFALFVYPPEILNMNEEDRARVAHHVNGDDALALSFWANNIRKETISDKDKMVVGKEINKLLRIAAKNYINLIDEIPNLRIFLAKFATLLSHETKNEIRIDGRRLGFIYRNIIATRAVELAKAMLYNKEPAEFKISAKHTIIASIPVGINDDSVNKETVAHQIETVFDLLSEYFTEDSDIGKINMIYELFTTQDILRKVEILLKSDLNEMVKTKAWNELIKSSEDITPLSYVAMQVEAKHPGTIPSEMIDHLGGRIRPENLVSNSIKSLKNESIEYIDELEELLDQPDDLGKMIAIYHAKKAAHEDEFNIKELIKTVKSDIKTLNALIS